LGLRGGGKGKSEKKKVLQKQGGEEAGGGVHRARDDMGNGKGFYLWMFAGGEGRRDMGFSINSTNWSIVVIPSLQCDWARGGTDKVALLRKEQYGERANPRMVSM